MEALELQNATQKRKERVVSLAIPCLDSVDDFAALVLPRVHERISYIKNGKERVHSEPRGYVFVRDKKFGPDALWKMPGGHKKPMESPLETAIRELAGETNLKVAPQEFHYGGQWLGERGDHWKIILTADVELKELGWMGANHAENEGEEPKFFTTDQFYELVCQERFMREHYEKLVDFALILPFDRDKEMAGATA